MYPPVLLVSRSPRRQEILANLGVRFTVHPSPFEENVPERHPDPPALAAEFARRKLESAGLPENSAGVAVAADTLVFRGDRVLGKPTDESQARVMLRELAGRRHSVVTALCLGRPGGEVVVEGCAVTRVTFDPMPGPLLESYLASQEWRDKAGAYAIQGLAAQFIKGIQGCYFNVVGFPVNVFHHLLSRLDSLTGGPAEPTTRIGRR